jgi:5-methyltetrahydropteroyltriglutamate--homocysteine methyltransferase
MRLESREMAGGSEGDQRSMRPRLEHPEWNAERIVRFAKLVGRERVVASADCGFSSQALYKTEVHETVVWEKFKALCQGADIATKQLWGR